MERYFLRLVPKVSKFCNPVVGSSSWCTLHHQICDPACTLNFKEGSVTRAGSVAASKFKFKFVGGLNTGFKFPTARFNRKLPVGFKVYGANVLAARSAALTTPRDLPLWGRRIQFKFGMLN